jgi:hypothetical protein
VKKAKIIAIIVSILSLERFSSTSWTANVQRYYSNPYDAESYIDLNKGISMESYIRTKTQPYPGSIKENSLQNYPFPNSQERKELYFQPSDGSMTNGTYEANSKTAKTALHQYTNVMIVNGTVQTPKLNNKGQYVDSKGNALESIGSMSVPAQDASPSDTNTYYLFGQVVPSKTTAATKIAPTQDYNSAGE